MNVACLTKNVNDKKNTKLIIRSNFLKQQIVTFTLKQYCLLHVEGTMKMTVVPTKIFLKDVLLNPTSLHLVVAPGFFQNVQCVTVQPVILKTNLRNATRVITALVFRLVQLTVMQCSSTFIFTVD